MKRPGILKLWLAVALNALAITASAAVKVYRAADFGIRPGTGKSQSALMQKAIESIVQQSGKKDKVVFHLEEGRYDFYPEDATQREYYISNHDQFNSKNVGIALEDLNHFTLEGNGAQLVFHGRMLPISLLRSAHCRIQNLSIDFENPHIAQITIMENDAEKGITFKPAPWVKHRLTEDGRFLAYGIGWEWTLGWGIAFEGNSRHIVYSTSDLSCPIVNARQVGENTYQVSNWKDSRLPAGTVIALRNGQRPAPGIFLSHNTDTEVRNVKVHYCEGMGLLAQLCEDITLDGFSTCLKGEDDPRYFTTQADATHFSGCKGKIVSVNGLYEGMMDDAINVHGTYLKVMKRVDDYTLEGRYMHGQAWGFDWGFAGDKVQFIRSKTMEILDGENKVASIEPADKPTMHGARLFRIRFEKPVPAEVSGQGSYGIENLTWTPEVYFAHNTIRNNRARGALFSTPQKVLVEKNLFDHTSGCAILLCGDCNGWFETGACRNVTIRNNRFINSLTSQFQFTNAVISIYPEIPELDKQQKLFHGGKKNAIRIIDNEFVTFDAPLLYAKSVDGLLYKGNTLVTNNDFPPLHWNRHRFFLQRVRNVNIENVLYDKGNILKEVKLISCEK